MSDSGHLLVNRSRYDSRAFEVHVRRWRIDSFGLPDVDTNDMVSIADRIERARRQIELGRVAITRQKEMVERHRADGRDTRPAENLLSVLERTQKVFERDLADLEKGHQRRLR